MCAVSRDASNVHLRRSKYSRQQQLTKTESMMRAPRLCIWSHNGLKSEKTRAQFWEVVLVLFASQRLKSTVLKIFSNGMAPNWPDLQIEEKTSKNVYFSLWGHRACNHSYTYYLLHYFFLFLAHCEVLCFEKHRTCVFTITLPITKYPHIHPNSNRIWTVHW